MTNINAQKIDKNQLEMFGMINISFLVNDKNKKSRLL